MFQADMTKHLLSLDHPGAQKHKQGRRAFTLLNSERKHIERKFSQEYYAINKRPRPDYHPQLQIFFRKIKD